MNGQAGDVRRLEGVRAGQDPLAGREPALAVIAIEAAACLGHWHTGDVQLLETDAAQLRRHLGWLLEDLRAVRPAPAGREPALATLLAEVEACLGQFTRLDGLLATLRRELRAA